MNSPLKSDLVACVKDKQEWNCPLILLPDDKGNLTDIVQYIGGNCRPSLRGVHHHLSNQFVDTTQATRDNLTYTIRLACSVAGFAVVLNGWKEKENTLQYECKRNRVYQPSTIKGDHSRTNRPVVHEQKCSFHFTLHYCVHAKHYYLKSGTGNATHKGHLMKKETYFKNGAKFLPEDEIKNGKDAVSVQLDPTALQALEHKKK
jgi:hypothetical protein